MPISRRGFFRERGGALVASLATAKELRRKVLHQILPARSVAPTNQKWVMVIDLAKCDGCGDCTQGLQCHAFCAPDAGMDQGLRGAGQPGSRALLHGSALHALRQPSLRAWMPGGSHLQAHRRACHDGSGPLHRLPELHRPVPLRSAFLQLERTAPHAGRAFPSLFDGRGMAPSQRRGREVRLLPGDVARGKTDGLRREVHHGRHLLSATNMRTPSQTARAKPSSSPRSPRQGAGFRLLEELGTDPRVYYLPPANRKYAAPGEAKS